MTDRITRQDRIILYLNKYVNIPRNGYTMPQTMTQDGIACALRMSRSHVSNVLGILEEKGLVEHGWAHSDGGSRKRRIYYLLPLGIATVPEIRDRMERQGESPEEFCAMTYPGNIEASLNILKADVELENARESMDRLLNGKGGCVEVMRSLNRAIDLLIREVI